MRTLRVFLFSKYFYVLCARNCSKSFTVARSFNLLNNPMIIQHLGILEELKAGFQTDTFIPIFIEVLFTIAEKWTQSKCPLVGEWVNST